ncbi:MAG: hypothetical protein JWO15_1808 [Sphingomonadales bacterium]|nr:hypothetical protein [Sphingomonadales bacterium]
MAGADYNGIEGLIRITAAGDKLDDTFAIEVLAFHAALEVELDIVLRALLIRPDAILKAKGKRLSFPQKAQLLVALWKGDAEKADKLNVVLQAFEDLRNEVAHMGDEPLKSWKAKLDAAFREIEPDTGDDPSLYEIAQGTAFYMADGHSVADFVAAMNGLEKLVNATMPKIFGNKVEANGEA